MCARRVITASPGTSLSAVCSRGTLGTDAPRHATARTPGRSAHAHVPCRARQHPTPVDLYLTRHRYEEHDDEEAEDDGAPVVRVNAAD